VRKEQHTHVRTKKKTHRQNAIDTYGIARPRLYRRRAAFEWQDFKSIIDANESMTMARHKKKTPANTANALQVTMDRETTPGTQTQPSRGQEERMTASSKHCPQKAKHKRASSPDTRPAAEVQDSKS